MDEPDQEPSDYEMMLQKLNEDNEQLERNILGEVRDYLKKKDDTIKDLLKQLEEMSKSSAEKDEKIAQLKGIINDALDKI